MNSPIELGFDHRFVASTAPEAERGPTLLLLHGTGGDGASLLQLGYTLSPPSALLSPTGKVREGGAARFFRRLAEGVFDVADLRLRTRQLASFVRDAITAYGLDPARIVAVGYSNGANITASMLLSGESVLAGAALFRAMVPFEPSQPADVHGAPVLLCSGTSDPIATPVETARLTELLTAAHARVDVHREPVGHQLVMGDIKAATDWVQREFPPSAPRLNPGVQH
ncbi:MAG: alpha/beta hydrolase [Gemmatimonadaceae bacterium]